MERNSWDEGPARNEQRDDPSEDAASDKHERAADEAFIAGMEGVGPEPATFGHREHVRLAWLYVHRYGPHDAEDRLARTISRFAARHGATGKFHATMTIAWARLVASAIATWGASTPHDGSTPNGADFEAFIARNPDLLDRGALGRFYTSERLDSDTARSAWCEPDLRPLPKSFCDSRTAGAREDA